MSNISAIPDKFFAFNKAIKTESNYNYRFSFDQIKISRGFKSKK